MFIRCYLPLVGCLWYVNILYVLFFPLNPDVYGQELVETRAVWWPLKNTNAQIAEV